MSYANLPPNLAQIFDRLNARIDKLERANRFGAPNLATAPTLPRGGDIYYDTTSTTMKYWNGSAWVELADGNAGTTKISGQGTLAATGLTYSSNPTSISGVKVGKSFVSLIQVNCASITNFGTGQWTIQMPAGTPNATAQQATVGTIEVAGGQHYPIYVTIEGTGTTMYLWYLQTTGNLQWLQPVTGTAPVTMTTATQIYINGTAILV